MGVDPTPDLPPHPNPQHSEKSGQRQTFIPKCRRPGVSFTAPRRPPCLRTGMQTVPLGPQGRPDKLGDGK